MRKTITWEGEEKVPGVIIEKGALTWTEPLPVCWSFDFAQLPFGNARDLHRENDGRITAEIDLSDETIKQKHAKIAVDAGDLAFAIFANQLVESRDEGTDLRHVFAGEIRSVNMVIRGSVGWD